MDSGVTVTVGKTGLVRGILKAKRLVVAGRFAGTAECVRVELAVGGWTKVKLAYSELVVRAGACSRAGASTWRNPWFYGIFPRDGEAAAGMGTATPPDRLAGIPRLAMQVESAHRRFSLN
ncbi:MAG: polymer-forming cytoskeletal protein [Gammaproteobacteria bacterium]|nr:polymer-forming cytoskeletal protein [Gammaproteobacteria bacterium]